MATIKPFAGLRPNRELASEICELPYDVLSSQEAREAAAGNPLSFFHVSKPEIDLPAETDPYDARVYTKGKENLKTLISEGVLRQDAEPHFYLYRQVMKGHSQVGLVAVASCQEYMDDVILKHEFTRPEKEDDRVRHIETLHSQTGPVFLTYCSEPQLEKIIRRHVEEEPEVDFYAKDGVRHSAWVIRSTEDEKEIESIFQGIPKLYIADGHHRSAAAARVYQSRQGRGGSGWFLSVIFPHNQMQILPYNRALKDLNGMTSDQLLQRLDAVLTKKNSGDPTPQQPHEVSLFMDGEWRTYQFRESAQRSEDPVEGLDVYRLQKLVLEPLFGIEDPRRSKRISFVGGIRGTEELEKLVRSGAFACAFSMFPTRIEDLMAVSDAGGIMPPKSTWFEPKLRDGMFCHMI